MNFDWYLFSNEKILLSTFISPLVSLAIAINYWCYEVISWLSASLFIFETAGFRVPSRKLMKYRLDRWVVWRTRAVQFRPARLSELKPKTWCHRPRSFQVRSHVKQSMLSNLFFECYQSLQYMIFMRCFLIVLFKENSQTYLKNKFCLEMFIIYILLFFNNQKASCLCARVVRVCNYTFRLLMFWQ